MVSTKKRGAAKELLAQKELQREGWTVLFRSCTVKRGPCFVGLDFADLFDLVAARQVGLDPQWAFISVKNWADGRKHPHHQAELEQFKEKYGTREMRFELWLWIKARWRGRGKNKQWEQAQWKKIEVI